MTSARNASASPRVRVRVRRVLGAVALAGGFIAGCSSSPAPSTVAAAPPDPLALRAVDDKNPDPNVVEFDLEAREADKSYGSAPATRVWTYNGTVPGPLVDAKVGDRVVIHFKNSLPEPTTIHWHGIRLPATMDGSLAMQDPIAPGGTFEYAFTLKDAGLFWFHPHMRSDIQVQKGLYGVIRVRGNDEPAADSERILVLDDSRVAPDGTVSETLDDTSKMMGREGKTLLVNGVPSARLPIEAGSLARFRILNVANGRFFNLRVAGQKLRVLGTDGGHFATPFDVDTLLISPGERYDVMVKMDGAAGTELALTNEAYDRGHDSGGAPPMEVMRFVLSKASQLSDKTFPSAFPATPRLADPPGGMGVELNEMLRGEDVVFTINGKAFPDVPPFAVPLGQVRAIDITNKSEMDHPFHLHGFFFQVLAKDGAAVPPEQLVDKDTVIVRAKSTMRIVARFDEPGKWMYHCHILEHGEAGMMGEIDVQ
jgi:FtsP/CotA-like multicopper oxidase with cupredoxin domain